MVEWRAEQPPEKRRVLASDAAAVAEMRAENERVRTALRKIASSACECACEGVEGCANEHCCAAGHSVCWPHFAKAALAAEPKP